MAEIRENHKEIAVIIESAMRDFNAAMKSREELSLRIAKRTTQIIRFSMFGAILLMAAIIVLLYILTSEMNHMTSHLEEIGTRIGIVNQHVGSMSIELQRIGLSVEEMERSMEVLNGSLETIPAMNRAMDQISQDMKKLNQNIALISTDVAAIRQPLNNMSVDLARTRDQVLGVNRTLGIVGRDADRMMTPIKFLPFLPR